MATQPGAIKLARQYGDALVCVRYRHDAENQIRYTTVELVVEKVPIQPRSGATDVMVKVKLPFEERTLRALILARGGIWDDKEKIWRMPLRIAKKLLLVDHLVL